ncbi:copper resistance system multicopper oxidase [Thermomonas hydrothermalis]|uniref:Copper-resistance protein, CopA family n=1 Tax=Thermomonas hydrothermalis TaxID=213588 RepID=A0A1M4XVW2_9GAMM|nr:copper resistance system multicopper oxidase [Thermomonas hydrothermalis]SHE97619.1 copper-resistance protein, CopA family [Thermomonas hydrothermalis]
MPTSPDPIRRRLLQGLALGSAALGLGLWRRPAWATPFAAQPAVLHGDRFDLVIGRTPVNITGRTVPAFTVNGCLPGPILRWREGDTVCIRVRNTLAETSSIHWHGLLLPANMDGVPGMSFDGIPPGGDYLYQFKVRQSGTYWYHSHSSLQEQAGLLGAIIIDPSGPDPLACERDYVVLLSDWTDLPPHRLLARMKKRSDYDNLYKRTVGDFFRDVRTMGLHATLADRKAWGAMRMSPTDLADVNGHTYTYLANGHTAAQNWTALFTPGERVRLRFINGAAMTFFDVRIPGLTMTVVAADGQPIQPVDIDEFRIAPAETFDVIVQPQDDAAYTVFAQAMDRSGYTRITLAPRPGMQADIPVLDPRPRLTMDDMGHGGHGKVGEMTCGAAMAMTGMDHGTHGSAMQRHPASETGNPDVDMQTMMPVPRLDDPGIGLRDNGRRVLRYADLHSLQPPADDREPSRTIELHLTGNMERFTWGFDGIRFADAAPIRLRYGERVRITLVNDTMMEHPIHLHGMWSDLEDEHGQFLVRKHTVSVPPGTKRSVRVTADALGRWAFHCHMLLHMESGMMREVRVDE